MIATNYKKQSEKFRFDNPQTHSNVLESVCPFGKLLKLGLDTDEFQTIRGVWSVCNDHQHIEQDSTLFVTLWRKHYASSKSTNNSVASSKQPCSAISDSATSPSPSPSSVQSMSIAIDSEPECMGCGSIEDESNFLLCDNDKIAKHGCHLYCLEPPLTEIPSTDWFCPSCTKTKHINKRCCYCLSKMYDTKHDVLICNKNKKCSSVAHRECAKKANHISSSKPKWKCPDCAHRKKIQFIRKNNKLVPRSPTVDTDEKETINTEKTKKKAKKKEKKNELEIDWNLFEVVEENETCSVGESCKRWKEGKRHWGFGCAKAVL